MNDRLVRAIDVVDGALASLVPGRDPGARRWRLGAAGVVALTGTVLLVPNVAPLAGSARSPLAVGLGTLGTLVSAAVVAVGYLLARSDIDPANAVRIALWNVLGVVVLGGVLAANLAVTGATGPFDASPFVVGNVLAVGAGAHVVIGVYDARRVRADQLDRQREKLAVLGRVLRHNLRNEATVIVGHGERLHDGVADPDLRTSAAAVCRAGETVGSLADRAEEMMAVVDRGDDPPTRVDVAAAATDVVARARERYPGAVVELVTGGGGGDAAGSGSGTGATGPDGSGVPDEGYVAWADPALATALWHLVENAVRHGSSHAESAPVVADDPQAAGPGRDAATTDPAATRTTAVAADGRDAGDAAGPDGDDGGTVPGDGNGVTVTVRLVRDGDRVRVTVADDGPGIPAVERGVVTGETERSQLTHGSGLGLWVVQTVVEAGGGRLAFEDPPTGAAVTLSHRAAD
jgi:signal transduction histidine kinase